MKDFLFLVHVVSTLHEFSQTPIKDEYGTMGILKNLDSKKGILSPFSLQKILLMEDFLSLGIQLMQYFLLPTKKTEIGQVTRKSW